MLTFDLAALELARSATPDPRFPLKASLPLGAMPHIQIYGQPNTGKTATALSAFPAAAAFQMSNSHLTVQARYGIVAQGAALGKHTPIPVVDNEWLKWKQGLAMPGTDPEKVWPKHPVLAFNTVSRSIIPVCDQRPAILDEFTNWETRNKALWVDGRFVGKDGGPDTGAEWLANGQMLAGLVTAATAHHVPLIVLGHEVEAGSRTFMGKTTNFNEGLAASSQKQAERFATLFGLRLRTEKRLFQGVSRFVFAADPFKLRATQTDRLDVIRGVCPANLRMVLQAAGFNLSWGHWRFVPGQAEPVYVDGAALESVVQTTISEGLRVLWTKLPSDEEALVAVFRRLKASLNAALRGHPDIQALGLATDPTLLLWCWEAVRDAIELVVGFYEVDAATI